MQIKIEYTMPAEWENHACTWFSWAQNKDTWTQEDGKYDKMIIDYATLIGTLAQFEKVCVNVADLEMEKYAISKIQDNGFNTSNISFFYHPTNDAWCRDHGPIFVRNKENKKVILNWEYNAWGGKYPPFDLDNQIPNLISKKLNLPMISPGIVLEGGSIEVNGKGTLLTTRACLLNKNRNPHLNQTQIEAYLTQYLGATNILWLEDGIVGDDTDGHIDDLTRFVNETTVVNIIEHNKTDENYHILKENAETLATLKDQDGKFFNIIELPMPKPLIVDNTRLPASYANFLIANGVVLVPTFEDKNDNLALNILQKCFHDRKVLGINCKNIVWGLGTIHCLSQQEPL